MQIVKTSADSLTVMFTTEEITLIEHAILETLEEIEEWEYQTRTGFTRSETLNLLEEIKNRGPRGEITLNDEKLSLLNNVFNEILNGFHNWKLQPYTSRRANESKQLFREIRQARNLPDSDLSKYRACLE